MIGIQYQKLIGIIRHISRVWDHRQIPDQAVGVENPAEKVVQAVEGDLVVAPRSAVKRIRFIAVSAAITIPSETPGIRNRVVIRGKRH